MQSDHDFSILLETHTQGRVRKLYSWFESSMIMPHVTEVTCLNQSNPLSLAKKLTH